MTQKKDALDKIVARVVSPVPFDELHIIFHNWGTVPASLECYYLPKQIHSTRAYVGLQPTRELTPLSVETLRTQAPGTSGSVDTGTCAASQTAAEIWTQGVKKHCSYPTRSSLPKETRGEENSTRSCSQTKPSSSDGSISLPYSASSDNWNSQTSPLMLPNQAKQQWRFYLPSLFRQF